MEELTGVLRGSGGSEGGSLTPAATIGTPVTPRAPAVLSTMSPPICLPPAVSLFSSVPSEPVPEPTVSNYFFLKP